MPILWEEPPDPPDEVRCDFCGQPTPKLLPPDIHAREICDLCYLKLRERLAAKIRRQEVAS